MKTQIRENEILSPLELRTIIPEYIGFSQKALNYYFEKKYWGPIPDADLISETTGSCGDTMMVYLKIREDVIVDARFAVRGCIGTVVAAMAAGDLIIGKTLLQARSITDGDIFRELEEIPAKKHHCIQLAAKTLHQALDTYQAKL
ncbi:MAG: iron-sulfur cluster assembly scaffold protein [Deltaproteobacteria bacterium]|nr:iron-sulfur cluster assembly scaffold protein [Deltaproteobacteria bacterium]